MIINKNIFIELGIEKISESKQREIAVKLENIILNRLSVRAMKELSPEKKKKYVEILQFGKSADIYNFLSDNIPNFEDLAEKVAVEVVEEFKAGLND
jgi:hypothetical protein